MSKVYEAYLDDLEIPSGADEYLTEIFEEKEEELELLKKRLEKLENALEWYAELSILGKEAREALKEDLC